MYLLRLRIGNKWCGDGKAELFCDLDVFANSNAEIHYIEFTICGIETITRTKENVKYRKAVSQLKVSWILGIIGEIISYHECKRKVFKAIETGYTFKNVGGGISSEFIIIIAEYFIRGKIIGNPYLW